MKKYILSSFLLLSPVIIFTQTSLSGMIMDSVNPKDNLGVEGASIHWLNTNISTISNSKGWFKIPYEKTYKKLVISYLGYQTGIPRSLISSYVDHLPLLFLY